MKQLNSLLKQPLVHFLILGGLLFAVHQWLNPNTPTKVDAHVITINEAAVVSHIQNQRPTLSEAEALTYWQGLAAKQQQQVIDVLIRDEVLFREAQALQLERNDAVIKRRLIQKMQYLVSGFNTSAAPSKTAVEGYYRQNLKRYHQSPHATFSHVYITTTNSASLSKLQQQLNTGPVAFHQAAAYGERFIYQRNYIDRSAELIRAHFGSDFEQALFALAPSSKQWQGPIESQHGWHFVMLSGLTEGGVPPLATIYPQVQQDTAQHLAAQQQNEAISQLQAQYTVVNTLQ